jgi:hypothetical protein
LMNAGFRQAPPGCGVFRRPKWYSTVLCKWELQARGCVPVG